jgi:Arc/MetJ family transcription regulator
MRTNIEIEDALIEEARALTGLPTKRAVVEAALRALIGLKKQSGGLSDIRGIGWTGDLEAMRLDQGAGKL